MNEKARNHLLNRGFVYTFRRRRRRQFAHKPEEPDFEQVNDWFTDKRCGKKIADVKIQEVGKVRVEDLEPCVEDSGFASLKEWGNAIYGLVKQTPIAHIEGWLYGISLREG